MNKAVWVKSSVEKSNDCGKTLKYPLMSLMSKKNSNCLLQLFRFAETHGELDDYSIVRRRWGPPPGRFTFCVQVAVQITPGISLYSNSMENGRWLAWLNTVFCGVSMALARSYGKSDDKLTKIWVKSACHGKLGPWGCESPNHSASLSVKWMFRERSKSSHRVQNPCWWHINLLTRS